MISPLLPFFFGFGLLVVCAEADILMVLNLGYEKLLGFPNFGVELNLEMGFTKAISAAIFSWRKVLALKWQRWWKATSFQAGKAETRRTRIGHVISNWLTGDSISSNEIYESKWELDTCHILTGLFEWL